jgi:acetyl-CoA carboxylase biotin carboxyl carrier protein
MKESKKQPQSSESGAPEVNLGQLESLLALMGTHGIEELEYSFGGLHIHLRKPSPAGTQVRGAQISAESMYVGGPPPQQAAPQAVPAAAVPTPPPAAVAPPVEEFHAIKSPIVGTFYGAPNPDAPPFVKVGDTVQAGQTICIIEAMKLMNEIEADVAGEIVRVLIENGQPVEYGEALFEVRPAKKK